MNPDRNDIIIIMGLAFLSAGLFLWFGLGPALTADGVILTALGLLGR